MKHSKFITLTLLAPLLFIASAHAEVQVEINKALACCVDSEASKNTQLVKNKNQGKIAITSFIKKTKRKIKKRQTPAAKRKKLKALLRKVKQCQAQKGDYNPEDLPMPKTGPAFAKTTLITTGTGIAIKCNLVITEDGTQTETPKLASGGSIYCSMNSATTARSVSFFLFGNGEVLSQALTNVLIIPNNGQFSNISVNLDAETAEAARVFLRGSNTSLSADLKLTSSTSQTFDFQGVFEETSGEGDCRLQASITGQGNSGQVFFDLGDGSVNVQLGDPVANLTTLNIFAGNTTNAPTVGQFAIPQSIIDVLPQSEFSFTLEPEDLAKVVNAVSEISEELTVAIPQSPVDATLVGRFTTPQTDCAAAQ